MLTDEKGKYNRYVICFDNQMKSYTVRECRNIPYSNVNFTVLPSGICAHMPTDDEIEVFVGNNKVKTIKNPPITTEMRLVNDRMSVMFINRNALYSITMK